MHNRSFFSVEFSYIPKSVIKACRDSGPEDNARLVFYRFGIKNKNSFLHRELFFDSIGISF